MKGRVESDGHASQYTTYSTSKGRLKWTDKQKLRTLAKNNRPHHLFITLKIDMKFSIRNVMTNSACILIALGCNAKDETAKVSNDMAGLRQLIDMPLKANFVKWEIFDSPEQTGLQLGPTESTILVAEFSPADASFFSTISPGEERFYVPEAERAWLDEQFRSLLRKKTDRIIDLSYKSRCRPITSTIVRTKKPAHGFTCIAKEKMLVYLTLVSDSMD
jgi:hypothetical protein